MIKEHTSAVHRDFRLYIEGVFVPLIRGHVSSSVGSPATAQVSIAATNLSMSFEPRSAVHIFYSDPDDVYDNSEIAVRRGRPKYKLLFEGELLGIGFNKSPTNRSVNLSCADISNNFDYAHKFVINGQSALLNSVMMTLYTGADGKVDIGPTAPVTSQIAELISDSKTVIEGVQSLIKEVFVGSDKKVGSNDFLRSVQERFKITEKVHAVDDVEIVKLVEIKHLLQIMTRVLDDRPSTFTLTEMINMFLGFVQYNRSSVLSPKYENGTFKSIILTPNTYFSPPPKCNVLFPDFYSNIGYDENFMRAPTRLFLQTQPTPFTDPQDAITARSSTYLAPSALKDLLPTGGGAKQTTDNFHKVLTEEEKIKGIVPVMKSSGYPEFVASVGAGNSAQAGGAKQGSSRNYLLNLADYEFEMRRASGRAMQTIVGVFNDNPVIGAPAVAIDSSFMFYGLLASVSHSFSCEDNGSAMTSYGFELPRFVQRVPSRFSNLDDQATAALEQLSKIFQDDLKVAPRRATLDISKYIEPIKKGGGSLKLVVLLEDIVGKCIDDRDSKLKDFFTLYNKGIYEQLPSVPRWVNAKFGNEQSGATYQELYGCRSSIDNTGLESDIFETISEAINDAADEHSSSGDPLQYAKTYTRRSGIVTQTNFEAHYGLPALESEFGYGAYPVKDDGSGIFTKSRQAAVKAYVKDLTESYAHLG